MLWTRSETLALASPSCVMCRGLGLRNGRQENTQPCNCALRAIFRACYARFYDIASDEKYISRINVEPSGGPEGVGGWGRKDEEFAADFCLVSRRALKELCRSGKPSYLRLYASFDSPYGGVEAAAGAVKAPFKTSLE